MDVSKLLERWILDYACKKKYFTVLIDAKQHHEDLDGYVSHIHLGILTADMVVRRADTSQFPQVIAIITELFEMAPDVVPFKQYARMLSGIKMLALFSMLKSSHKYTVPRLNQYFPNAGNAYPRADPTLRQRLINAEVEFRKFFLGLLSNKEEKEKYFKDEQYGDSFIQTVQTLTPQFLRRVMRKLPLTEIEQLMQSTEDSTLVKEVSSLNSPLVDLLLDQIRNKQVLSEQDVRLILDELRSNVTNSGSTPTQEGLHLVQTLSSGDSSNPGTADSIGQNQERKSLIYSQSNKLLSSDNKSNAQHLPATKNSLNKLHCNNESEVSHRLQKKRKILSPLLGSNKQSRIDSQQMVPTTRNSDVFRVETTNDHGIIASVLSEKVSEVLNRKSKSMLSLNKNSSAVATAISATGQESILCLCDTGKRRGSIVTVSSGETEIVNLCSNSDSIGQSPTAIVISSESEPTNSCKDSTDTNKSSDVVVSSNESRRSALGVESKRTFLCETANASVDKSTVVMGRVYRMKKSGNETHSIYVNTTKDETRTVPLECVTENTGTVNDTVVTTQDSDTQMFTPPDQVHVISSSSETSAYLTCDINSQSSQRTDTQSSQMTDRRCSPQSQLLPNDSSQSEKEKTECSLQEENIRRIKSSDNTSRVENSAIEDSQIASLETTNTQSVLPSSHSSDKFDMVCNTSLRQQKKSLPNIESHLQPDSVRQCIVLLIRNKDLERLVHGKIDGNYEFYT